MDSIQKDRRIMLKGALAAGCALAVPVLFSGCGKDEGKSKPKTVPQENAPGPGFPEAGSPKKAAPEAGSSAQTAAIKISKAQAQYQEQPKGEQQCANCMHFLSESNTCKLVEGQISAQGWCALWAAKG